MIVIDTITNTSTSSVSLTIKTTSDLLDHENHHNLLDNKTIMNSRESTIAVTLRDKNMLSISVNTIRIRIMNGRRITEKTCAEDGSSLSPWMLDLIESRSCLKPWEERSVTSCSYYFYIPLTYDVIGIKVLISSYALFK